MSAAPARAITAPAAAVASNAAPAAAAAAAVGGAAAAAASTRSAAAPARSGGNDTLLPFVAGSAGGLVSTALLQPLDVIRTRLQLPGASGAAAAGTARRVGGIAATVRSIVANESIAGLWKGGVPSTLRVGFGAGLYFGLQNRGLALARQFSANQNVSASVTASIGGGARIIAAVICAPISVIKTRFEAAATRQYNGVWHALRTISQREGLRGLYAGIGPTITRDAPYAGLHLLFYTRVKAALNRAAAAVHPNSVVAAVVVSPPALQFASGFVAGGAATAITHPFDVIKTRIQIERLSRLNAAAGSSAGAAAGAGAAAASPVLSYSGSAPATVFGSRSLAAARAVLRESGPIGLTAGMLPRLLKRALSNAMTWTLYEQIVTAGRGRTLL